jgi:radical SAM superfamily enzyme YgiQ (UPF0313 family)
MEAQWYRNQGHEVKWNDWSYPNGGIYDKIITQEEGLPFLSLPQPDREFTRAKSLCYQNNGNFKYHPGTYIQSASGCWWGNCEFCVEKEKKYEVRPVEDVISEIEEIKSQGYKEVFDDSATFPMESQWLDIFIRHITRIGMFWSCNMRLVDYPFKDFFSSGCRMVLFGVESANQKTLDRINKGVDIEKGIECIKKASKAGLEPHIAVMFGYPWESDKEARQTLRLVHYLLRKGYAKTAQASFYNGGDKVSSSESHRKYVSRIYSVAYSPQFWFNQLKDIRDINDIKYLWRKIKAGVGL